MSDNSSKTSAQLTPNDIEKDIIKCRNLIRDGSISDALDLLKTLLDSNQNNTDSIGYINLQLANANLYLQQSNDAVTIADTIIPQAKEDRDALLSIAALVTKGEAIIDMVTFDNYDEIQAAIEAFGKALGISEFFDDEKMTVLPLAGLAHAHWLWGNPKKAMELCERSQLRAEVVEGDEREMLKARALLSHAITQQSPDTFHKAIEQVSIAKHISLKNRIERFYDFYKDDLVL